MTGRIVDWNRERGFGYLEAEGRRVFLHIRDFKERHRQPEVGDRIHFEMGTDRQGRICATGAVHLNDGGRLRLRHFLFLGILVGLPALAVYRGMGPVAAGWIGGWCAAVSFFAYLIYAWDKRQAKDQARREPERLLHFVGLAGGWPGAFLAQRHLRHKSSKLTFQFVFWLIVLAYEFVAVDFLLGWPVWHRIVEAIR